MDQGLDRPEPTLPPPLHSDDEQESAVMTTWLVITLIGLVAAFVLTWNGQLGTPPQFGLQIPAFLANTAVSPSASGQAPDANVALPTPTSAPAPPSRTPASAQPRAITIHWSRVHPHWTRMTLTRFPPGRYDYTCNFLRSGRLTFSLKKTTEPQTWDTGNTCYDTIRGDTMWVTINSVTSNKITVA